MTQRLMRKPIIPEPISIRLMAFRPEVRYRLRFHGTRSFRRTSTSLSTGTMAVRYIFDSGAALSAAHKADKDSPLSLTSSSPVVSCEACEQPLTIYEDTLAYPPSIPFQLVEYTFADVGTPAGGKPYIIDLNVGYNV